MVLVLIILIVLVIAIVILYSIGKKVRAREAQFDIMFREQEAVNRLRKYERKSTPKVPKIKK